MIITTTLGNFSLGVLSYVFESHGASISNEVVVLTNDTDFVIVA